MALFSTLPHYFLFLVALTLTLTLTHQARSNNMIFTLVNNCPFPVWPAIQPNAGHPVLEKGGFALSSLTHRSFYAPTAHWSGRMWARTHCSYTNGRFSCATGDCANRLECDGAGGATPATLAQFSIHHGPDDRSSYGVSLVDGYNVPLTITPHEGRGQCPVVGCRPDLLPSCPAPLQKRLTTPHGSYIIACKSGCEAFNTDELCCRGKYNDARVCKASSYSEYFKHSCPSTFTYAHDSPSMMHECSAPRELKIIFCH